MKTTHAILLGSILLCFGLYITAYRIEDGNGSAIGMYFVVFLIPALLLALLNGLLLHSAKKMKKISLARLLSMVPVLLLLILTILEEARLSILDGDLSFIGGLGLVAIGLTNVIWNIKLTKIT